MTSTGVADSQPTIASPFFGSADNLRAVAGGGQQPSAPLASGTTFYRVTTVANSNDSVTLPLSKAGMFLVVTNAHATNSVNVFPNLGDNINALGTNNAFALAAGKVALFFCVSAGQWHSLLTS
jgi:hypothetical protein